MKKILLSIALLCSFVINAQLTQTNHAPVSGDTFSTNQCDSTGIMVGTSGANSLWNFSAITIHSSITNNYVATVSTNTANSGSIKVSSSLTNSSYYSSSATKLNYFGGNVTVGPLNAELNYTSPAIVALYPMSLNTTTSNVVSGTGVITPLVGNVTFTGNSSVIADGTGTLVIGTRTLTNAIRLKTSQLINATASFGNATITLVDYDYYAAATSKRPFLTISTSTLSSTLGGTSTQTIVTALKNFTNVGLMETANEAIELSVFPNPSNSFVTFNTNSENAYQIKSFDVTGRLITSEQFENNKATLTVANLNSGVYLYTVLNKNNQVVKSGKFIVTK